MADTRFPLDMVSVTGGMPSFGAITSLSVMGVDVAVDSSSRQIRLHYRGHHKIVTHRHITEATIGTEAVVTEEIHKFKAWVDEKEPKPGVFSEKDFVDLSDMASARMASGSSLHVTSASGRETAGSGHTEVIFLDEAEDRGMEGKPSISLDGKKMFITTRSRTTYEGMFRGVGDFEERPFMMVEDDDASPRVSKMVFMDQIEAIEVEA